MKNVKRLVFGLFIALVVWVGFSWGEVIANNVHEHPVYNDYNFFEVVFCNN